MFRKGGIGTVSSQAISVTPSEAVVESVLLCCNVGLTVSDER